MRNKTATTGLVDIALGLIATDGLFCLAFTLHLLNKPAGALTMAHFLVMGLILCVLCTSCWIIYDDYWQAHGTPGARRVVKKLRINELEQGAAIEFDGKSYRVDTINRACGEILISRIGEPGTIVVQIEGNS